MGKKIFVDVFDAALDEVATANRMDALTAEPADRAAVISDSRADVTMSGGDFTKAAGDSGGNSRKTTVAAKSSVLIDVSGTATHVSLIDATVVLVVTTCTPQALTANASNTVNFPAWDVEFQDPT